MADIRLPNIGYGDSVFDAGMKGLKQGQDEYDRDTLFEIGKKAIKGDWSGAQNQAFERGNLDAGFKIQGHQQQTADRARDLEKKISADAAGIFQNFIDKEADPAKRGAMTQQFITAHPEMGPRLQRYGVNLQDPQAISGFFQAQARGYQDPKKVEADNLDMDYKRAQIGALSRREDATKVMTVGNRLVRVPQSGPAQEIYNGGPDTTSRSKGAPSGYLWKDPNNPEAGVETIPGFDKPIPGDIAGKVAMMNMAQKRIEATRGVFERDWSAGDTAQYGAANVPIVGDLGFASGDIGIAQRDIRTGIEAALRTMTGAAAPEQEVTRYMQMFMPNIKDTKQTAKQKIDGLMKFMTDANELVLRGRGDTQNINQPQTAPEVTGSSQALARPQSKQDYDSMPPGTRYLDPTGTPRTKQ